MKTMSLKVPDSLDAQLTELARRTGRSKSVVVRLAIAEFLPKEGRGSHRTFLARALDLAGSVTAAPDLSVNKRRLEGYGR
ncbi:MAG: ribbon-helix-helix protein, CopG family [Thermoanaerobaculia bacterium]